MAKFPDTLFCICGYLPPAGESYGVAMAVLKSLENHTYFTQVVKNFEITAFEPLDFDFIRINFENNVIKKIGDEAVVCFISVEGIKFLDWSNMKSHLTVLYYRGLLEHNDVLEAAYIIQDSDLIDRSLEKEYTKILKYNQEDAKFFLLNNLLRDRVIESLPINLHALMKYTRINICASEVVVQIPDRASLNDRKMLEKAIESRIKSVSAFGEVTKTLFKEEPSLLERFAKCMREVSYDFPFSEIFLEQSKEKQIFIPDIFFEEPSDNITIAAAVLADVGLETVASKLSSGCRSFNLQQSRQVAAAAVVNFAEFEKNEPSLSGRVRVCAFKIREDLLMNGMPEEIGLLCISAAERFYESASHIVPTVFADSFYVSTEGLVSEKNYLAVETFELKDKILHISVIAKHRRSI